MKKTLILVQDRNNYFFKYVDDPNITICNAYRNGFLFKILKKLPIISIKAFGDWKEKISEYEKIIVFDSIYGRELAKYITKKVSKTSVFLYSWNTALDDAQSKLLVGAKKYFKVYSFDKNDCEKISIEYAPMCYCKAAAQIIQNDKLIYDVAFVGKDKGRGEYLHEIFEKLTKYGLKCKFYILGQSNPKYECDGFTYISKYLDPNINKELIASSKSILDIQQKGQEGLTIRVVDALFSKKKIITNKLDIDSYDFYNASNQFILGKDNLENIQSFLNKPYCETPDQILRNYEVSTWINVFK